NSFEAWPIERASFGSRVLPKSTKTITRMMISSVGPRFMRRAPSDPGLRGEVIPCLPGEEHQLPTTRCSGGKERVGEQLHVVERGDRERQRAGPDDERLDAERVPSLPLGAHLVDGAHEPAGAPFVEGSGNDTGGHEVAHAGEPALEVGVVLAGERVEAQRSPHRGRVTARLLAPP